MAAFRLQRSRAQPIRPRQRRTQLPVICHPPALPPRKTIPCFRRGKRPGAWRRHRHRWPSLRLHRRLHRTRATGLTVDEGHAAPPPCSAPLTAGRAPYQSEAMDARREVPAMRTAAFVSDVLSRYRWWAARRWWALPVIGGPVSVEQLVSIHERDAIYAVYREDLARRRRRSLAILASWTLLFGAVAFEIGNGVGQVAAYTNAGCVQNWPDRLASFGPTWTGANGSAASETPR